MVWITDDTLGLFFCGLTSGVEVVLSANVRFMGSIVPTVLAVGCALAVDRGFTEDVIVEGGGKIRDAIWYGKGAIFAHSGVGEGRSNWLSWSESALFPVTNGEESFQLFNCDTAESVLSKTSILGDLSHGGVIHSVNLAMDLAENVNWKPSISAARCFRIFKISKIPAKLSLDLLQLGLDVAQLPSAICSASTLANSINGYFSSK